jgi:hypothetical protein
MNRIRSGVEAFRRARGDRAGFWPSVDDGLSAAEQLAQEQAEERETRERLAHAQAAMARRCRRAPHVGWFPGDPL